MGKVSAVGIGPGAREKRTLEAEAVLARADAICGYETYLDLLEGDYPRGKLRRFPMKNETDRCIWALSRAAGGKHVAMVCSGDSGVYGMAGLLFSLRQQSPEWGSVEISVVPGVTAALSGAALLGAPLVNDFCVVSLSDLLTPWNMIEARLRGAGAGDFVVCLYNVGSRQRQDALERACRILLEYRPEDTPCAVVSNIGRAGESKRLLSLAELSWETGDMQSTVYVGNSQTRQMGDLLVTRRGYDREDL